MKRFGILTLVLILSILPKESASLDRKSLMKRWGYHEPSIEQILLVRHAEKDCFITTPIHIAQLPEETQAQTVTKNGHALLALGTTRDKHLARAIVYHELAHAQHDDPNLNLQIESGILDLADVLKSPDIQDILRSLKKYVFKALDALDQCSKASRAIHKITHLKDKKLLLQSIDDLGDGDEMMDLFEIEEHRADLFAMKHLLCHNLDDSISAFLIDLLKTELEGMVPESTASIMALTKDMFFIRRVLVIIGYLVEHNKDINKLLTTSEKHGTCENLYELDSEANYAIFASADASAV